MMIKMTNKKIDSLETKSKAERALKGHSKRVPSKN